MVCEQLIQILDELILVHAFSVWNLVGLEDEMLDVDDAVLIKAVFIVCAVVESLLQSLHGLTRHLALMAVEPRWNLKQKKWGQYTKVSLELTFAKPCFVDSAPIFSLTSLMYSFF